MILRVKYFAWPFSKTIMTAGFVEWPISRKKPGQKKGSAHANAAVNFPVGDIHTKVGEGNVPGKNVLIGAVDQRAIQIEKHWREWDHLVTFGEEAFGQRIDSFFIIGDRLQRCMQRFHQIFVSAFIAAVKGWRLLKKSLQGSAALKRLFIIAKIEFGRVERRANFRP